MIQEKSKMKICTKHFTKLMSIFSSNGWAIDNDVVGENRFNDFCDMLSRLNDQQQELILELTENFLWIGVQKYTREIKNVLNKIISDNKKEVMDSIVFHIVPLLKPSDIGKSKSSTFLAYFIKSSVRYYESLFINKKIMVYDSYNYILNNKNILDNSKIFLIDDFIGSGETAEESINYLLSNGVNKEKIIVIALVAQQEGIGRIQSLDIDVYASQIRKKGISDIYTTAEANKRLKIMDDIEKLIKVKPKYKFGYNGSQSLVSMSRTPNNTFPIYWLESKLIPIVPFPRAG